MTGSASVATVLSIREQVAARIQEEAEGLGPVEVPDGVGGQPPITPEFVEDCLDNNERGDGVLYAHLMRDRFLYVKKREKRPWLVWRGHHWAVDVMGEHIIAVEEVALVYLKAAEDLNEPISREKELLQEASSKVKAANERAKELKKLTEPDLEAQIACDAAGKQAELDSARHLANYKALQRKKKRYMERVDRLRAKPGAEKCVWWAHHLKNEYSLAIEGDEIDQKPMLLPCLNGVINCTTGKLQAGVPSDYLQRAIPVAYPEHLGWERIRHYLETGEGLPFTAWDEFIDSIVYPLADGTPDRDVALCLQKLLGNAITGDTSLQKVVFVIGDGRNGKGVLFQTVQGIMGELAWTIKAELLLDQKNQQSTAGPSPQLMSLRGKRLVVASETDKHRYISGARVKEFSGGDNINARGMYGDEEENIELTHHLFLQTNNVPGGVTKEFSLRQRLVIFDFPYRYVDDPELEARKAPHLAQWFKPKDGGLKKRLAEGWPYILLWLLRGAMLVQRDGLQLPDKVRADMEGLQLLEDHLEQYLCGCVREWAPDKTYEAGDVVNVRDPEKPDQDPGSIFSLKEHPEGETCMGEHPLESDRWRPEGVGLNPKKVSLFKEFYAGYKKWYLENVTEKEKDVPSTKNVAAEMRKKGFNVEAKGGNTKIYGEIRMILG